MKDKLMELTGHRLTAEKAFDIHRQIGCAVTGIVLTTEYGEKVIVDLGAVRWIGVDAFYDVMHPLKSPG